VPDGALVRHDLGSVAVELELSSKASNTYKGILLSYAGELGFRQVWWFVEPRPAHKRLASLVEHLGLRDLVQVYSAPTGVRVLPWP
jgi:hypothetical protein